MSTIMNLFTLPLSLPDTYGSATIADRPRAKVLGKPSGRMDGVDFALNPYVGCGFGCSYCYAAFFVADAERRSDWGNWVDVKSAALDEIELRSDLKGKLIFMSTATDPYQPLEMKLGLTRSLVEAMSEPSRQPRLVIQTRSPLVYRDVDLFQRYEHLRVNMTISTDCDQIRRSFEPKCASIERRLETLVKLKEAGIKIGVTVSPMLPLRDPKRFGRILADLNADHYAVSDFHDSDRPFTANTGSGARELLHAMKWTRDDYERCARILKDNLPTLRSYEELSNIAPWRKTRTL